MAIDYLADFPIPAKLLPTRLRGLLTPVGLDPRQFVEVACISEHDPHGPERECVHLQMAVVPGVEPCPVPVLREASQGVVSYSVPAGREIGCSADFVPSLTGNDYIVASWGSGSFYSFGLAEKVWMTLGLSPRCVGNEDQRLIYDDLELPEFGVADGRVSSDYHWTLQRDITWRMSNDYLRRYFWLRGARGIRSFFYEASVPDAPEFRALMNGKSHTVLSPDGTTAWYELDIREHRGRLLIQLWASVEAVMPERCPEQSADGIQWPGHQLPMTFDRANALIEIAPVYLNDKFLSRYEQNAFYDSVPVFYWEGWHCSPSYRGQWSFTDCQRVGRNLIKVPMRELYKPKPDREIVHAREFAVDPALLAEVNLEEEHIVAKVQRLLDALLHLGDGLSALGRVVGLAKSPTEIVGFDKAQIKAEGWHPYPALCRLAQVNRPGFSRHL